MPFTADDLARVDRAVARGVTTIEFADGRRVTYAGPAEMLKAREAIQRDLTRASGGAPSLRQVVTYRSGLCQGGGES